jgi:hypothetical protein
MPARSLRWPPRGLTAPMLCRSLLYVLWAGVLLVLHGAVAMPPGPCGLRSLGGCVGDELDWCLTTLLSQFQAG